MKRPPFLNQTLWQAIKQRLSLWQTTLFQHPQTTTLIALLQPDLPPGLPQMLKTYLEPVVALGSLCFLLCLASFGLLCMAGVMTAATLAALIFYYVFGISLNIASL